MSILFTLCILSICTVKPDGPDVFDQFQTQLNTVEAHQKKYQSIKHKLELNYSRQKYKTQLNSFYELYDKQTELKQSIRTVQPLNGSLMLKVVKILESSSITPYLKKELGRILHEQFWGIILSHDTIRAILNRLLLYDDIAHEQAWIEAMITQA